MNNWSHFYITQAKFYATTLFLFFLIVPPIIHCAFCFYPCGICEAPICCPGASTWQTTKCLVISCMSSLLKRELKHSLSAEGEERAISGGRGRRGCNVIKYALAPGECRGRGAICAQVIDARTSRPSPPHRPIKCHAALLWLEFVVAFSPTLSGSV